MKVTNDIKTWLSACHSEIVGLSINKSANKSCNEIEGSIYIELTKKDEFNKGLSKNSLEWLLERKYSEEHWSATGIILKARNQKIAYYFFNNKDDKYFIMNEAGVGYQDSLAYDYFYRRLNNSSNQKLEINLKDESLIIFPRGQYGHFIFDEVIPALTNFYGWKETAPKEIYLLMSQDWQLKTLEAICQDMFDLIPTIQVLKLPQCNLNITISGGLFTIPSYLKTLEQYASSRYKKEKAKKQSKYEIIYLSREGFDSQKLQRVVNTPAILQMMEEMGADIIKPHEIELKDLMQRASSAKLIISEPGTTPLIGYIAGGGRAQFIHLLSKRCITECPRHYMYSGWRYHVPWMKRIKAVIWGQPVEAYDNPFSDRCIYNEKDVRAALTKWKKEDLMEEI
ncbi:glycosyltransferase 61 family protein [Synechococcus sp. PROS-U-1]|uniref:glycosyltransferase 61 family protein n=1 Tax=Synechococcus sp. PROS-U-1 TaxID=1400866 RepID=UPI0016467F5C|nr:glycosyltransferase 61 family protein [Synechococcus sp. PROS-U-1]QNJ01758.1 hypothetical protein SynPROSU1_00111 [Synechococcus sp. PROS-U-1]